MLCVQTAISTEDTIKKSRFIGYLIPSQSAKDIATHLNRIRQQHPNANHIAFAYRIKTTKGILIRFDDAGEPSGTAGKPIYQHIEGKDLINVLCIVVRYFGGIKLGAGGLTRAYGNTAKKTIEQSNISEFIEHSQLKIKLNYNQLQLFTYQLEKLKGQIIEQAFSDKVELLVRIPDSNVDTLKEQMQSIFR